MARFAPLSILAFGLVALLSDCSAGTTVPAGITSPAAAAPRGHATERGRAGSLPSVQVHPGNAGPVVSSLLMGANMAVWYDITLPGIAASLQSVGLTATRWPGGSAADWYHWATNSSGPGVCSGHPRANSTFDNFMQQVAGPAHLDVAIAVNYGSNAACNGGGDPAEAAAWVAYANAQKGYGIKWWTVGNETWNPVEVDLNSPAHDPGTYARIESTEFYSQMKAASPTPINVCVNVNPKVPGWDAVVLANAQYDCVEMHFYAQGNDVDDTNLLTQRAPAFAQEIAQLQAELATAGHPNTPIYMGEMGTTGGTPGRQTQSIVQAIYAAEVMGDLMQAGIPRATWWMAYGGCDTRSAGGDFGRGIYGWQNWGGAMIFADQQRPTDGCPTPAVPATTPLATARTYQVLSNFVHGGEHVLGTTVSGNSNVLAYASTDGGGTALLLLNLNQNSSTTVSVGIDGVASGTGGPIVTYDKAIYDQTQNNVWNGPQTSSLAAWNGTFNVTLPAWSITVVQTH